MFGLIKQLFKGLLMFGFPLLMALCVWIILEPATFWQNLTTLIVASIVGSLSFVAVCLVLNELGD
jgi:hypothetical protein